MKVLWLQFHATNPPISFIFHIKCDPTQPERFWFRQTLSTEALTFIRSCSFYFMIDQLTIFCLVKHRSLRIHFYKYLIFVQIGCCNQTTISWMVRRSLVRCVCRFERGIFMQNHLCMELRNYRTVNNNIPHKVTCVLKSVPRTKKGLEKYAKRFVFLV